MNATLSNPTARRLFDRWRPATLDALAGHDKAKKALARFMASGGFGGRGYWISGPSGSGKTTVARIIAADLACPAFIEEIDAGQLTADRTEFLTGHWPYLAFDAKPGKALIVNEAHGLRRDTMRRLLCELEQLPPHVAVIFTTTARNENSFLDDHEDGGPLLSRCIRIKLETKGNENAFAEWAKAVAMAEGLDGKPVDAYKLLLARHDWNLRAALTEIEAGAMAD